MNYCYCFWLEKGQNEKHGNVILTTVTKVVKQAVKAKA